MIIIIQVNGSGEALSSDWIRDILSAPQARDRLISNRVVESLVTLRNFSPY